MRYSLIRVKEGLRTPSTPSASPTPYTFIFNSRYMSLAEHKPYEPLKKDGTQVFHSPKLTTVYTLEKRMMVLDADQGRALEQQVVELKALINAYKKGVLKETWD